MTQKEKTNFVEGKKKDNGLPEWWVETTLGEVCEIKYWKDHKKLKNGKYPLYGSGGIMRYVEKYLYDNESVLIPRKGTLGNLFYINEPFWTVDTLFYTKINKDKISPKYLFYKLKIKKLADLNVGSAVPSLTTKVLKGTIIKIPPLPEQKAIVSVLSSFDDKIELLRKENETLEKIGQVIFKEWFGKYSPDKPEELPEGWRVGKLGEIVDLLNGFAYKSSDFIENGKYRLVTIANVQDGFFVEQTKDGLYEIPQKMPDYCNLKTGDILLSLTGNVGRVCHVVGENYFLNQRVAKLQAKEKQDYGFIYTMFRQNSMIGLLESISSGTAQQNLSPVRTAELEVITPSRKILKDFTEIINPMIDKMLDNKIQIQSLSKTRDTLLPKLMKGEVRMET